MLELLKKEIKKSHYNHHSSYISRDPSEIMALRKLEKLEKDKEHIQKELQSNKVEIKKISENVLEKIVNIRIRDLCPIADDID